MLQIRVTGDTWDSPYLTARFLQHLSVLYCLFNLLKHSYLTRYRDREISMEEANWECVVCVGV